MKPTISHLSEDVRVVLSDQRQNRKAKLQVLRDGVWSTESTRPFALDIRVNALSAIERVAHQLNLI